jgi:hydroxymethylbilane synthase
LSISKITIGSRGSKLALWQANYIQEKLSNHAVESEIKIIKTKGDEIQHLSFDKIEGKGFFTKEIETALIDKEIDLAVHSLKDMETQAQKELSIAAVPIRENPSDTLLINPDSMDKSQELNIKKKGEIGTSSARRKNQLLLFREDLIIKDLRGNVPTRIQKLRDGYYDAIILAKAGINRLNIDVSDLYVLDLSPMTFIPAPAQGALGIQIRNSSVQLKQIVNKLAHKETLENVAFERKILNGIGGGCHSPMGAFSKTDKNGKRSTWVSYSENVNQTPIRFLSYSKDINTIVDRLKKKSQNKKVWISRKLNENSLFSKLLRNKGHSITGQSLIEKEIIKINQLPKCDWIFFNSIFSFDSIMHLKSQFLNMKIAAYGKSTAAYLEKNGLNVNFTGKGSPLETAEGYKKMLKNTETAFFPSSDKTIGSVQSLLNKKNKIVITTYNTSLIEDPVQSNDFYVFTSPSNVEAFFSTNQLTNNKVISIGPSTTKKLKDFGISEIKEAYESTELSLADAVFSLI